MKNTAILLTAMLALFACTPKNPDPETPTTPTTIETPAFALGADIGWASEMEAGGRKFKKKDGTQAALTEVLKDCGVNAIRLRVWVDPYKGWSGKADVVAAAKKAKAAGQALMIDFHYSDFFADPSRQVVPSAWNADKADAGKLATRVSAHTKDVLQALKDAGVQVHWVQVGNETRNGMLWPAGRLWDDSGKDIPGGWSNLVKLSNAGYEAAKAVYPSAIVMPHLNHGYEDNSWWFQKFKENGGKFDAIALSHYPQSDNLDEDGKPIITSAQCDSRAIDQIKALASAFHVPVYVAEVGVKQKESNASTVLSSFMKEVRKITSCKGVFYWEPEVDGTWKPEIYGNQSELRKYSGDATTGAWGPYDMGAFTTDGAPGAVMDAFH